MRVAISKLCGLAAGLACLLAVSSARAEIKFCNKFPHVVYVAIAYPQDEVSWISRGWLTLKTSECSPFDTALHVKTFYYRAESEGYREAGKRVKTTWGSGKQFAIWENDNFNYWDAQQKVLKSSLADFSKGAEMSGDAVSITITFNPAGEGSTITIKPIK